MQGKETHVDGLIYLIPKSQRTTESQAEYGFMPFNERDVNFTHIIFGSSLKNIDDNYKLIGDDTTQYPMNDGDSVIFGT